jgi:hypothetical protein
MSSSWKIKDMEKISIRRENTEDSAATPCYGGCKSMVNNKDIGFQRVCMDGVEQSRR